MGIDRWGGRALLVAVLGTVLVLGFTRWDTVAAVAIPTTTTHVLIVQAR